MADEPDEFAKMFDDLAKIGDPSPALVPIEEPAPVIVGETTSAQETEPVETVPETIDRTVTVEEPEPEPEPHPILNNDEMLARFAQIVRETPAPQPVQQQPVQQPQPAPAPALFTDAEAAELAAYEKDWPDVAKAESLRRRAEYQQLIQYVFDQVGQRLQPLEQMTMGGAERSHLNDIYTLVPDYDAVRDPVLQWVNQQPAYLKAAYQSVARQGTPGEIADLIGRYRQAVGAAPAPGVRVPAAPAPAPGVRKAAAALAPVKSARSGVGDTQPEDFDGAFAAFAKAI